MTPHLPGLSPQGIALLSLAVLDNAHPTRWLAVPLQLCFFERVTWVVPLVPDNMPAVPR